MRNNNISLLKKLQYHNTNTARHNDIMLQEKLCGIYRDYLMASHMVREAAWIEEGVGNEPMAILRVALFTLYTPTNREDNSNLCTNHSVVSMTQKNVRAPQDEHIVPQ